MYADLPPGPTVSGLQLFEIFTTNPFPFLRECFNTYGDLFTLPLGTFNVNAYAASGQWVFLSQADHLKILFNAEANTFLAGAANDIQFQQLLPRSGSVIIDGPQHIERRRILGKLVQGEKKIRGFTAAIEQLVVAEIDRFPARAAFALTPVLRRISNHVMQHLTFGALQDDDTAYIDAQLSEFGNPGRAQQDKLHLVDDCCAVLDRKIDQYRRCPHPANEDQSDIFSLLLTVENTHGGLSNDQIRAELLVILLGGTDTTTTTMAWIAAWILSNREVYRRVREELQQVLGANSLSSEAVDRLDYLDAAIKEACRISPVLFNSSARLLTQPLVLGDHVLPAGTIAASCSYLVHTRPDNYSLPLTFQPERFLGNKPDPYRWVPFGGGVRRCLGMAFALYEMKVVIATLLLRVELEPVDVRTEPELQGTFFAPAGSVTVRIAR